MTGCAMSVSANNTDRPQYVVGVDYGTLSGRALVVRVADGAEVGTAVHEYEHGVLDDALPGGGALPPDWALQDPDDYRRGAAPRGAGRRRRGRGRSGARHRHRHRLHRVHRAADAGRRNAAVRAGRVPRRGRTPTSSCGSTTPRSRRPTASTRWPTSGNEPWIAAIRRQDLRPSGSTPRVCSCSRRTPRSTPATERWIEAADWITWQLCGAETRNACTAGYKGILQDGAWPSRGRS